MGRVSRYKKVKSCYNSSFGEWGGSKNGNVQKKKRSRTAQRLKPHRKHEGRDMPVDEDEFDPRTFQVKAAVPKRSSPTVIDAAVSIANDVVMETPDDAKLFRQIGQQMKEGEKDKWKKDLGRMQGESKRSYKKRVKRETRSIIRESKVSEHNPEKREKKKEFLKQKKNKKRKLDTSQQIDTYDEADDEPRPEPVVFGDCVERPPVFSQLPRGAPAAKRSSNPSSIEALREEVQKQYAALRERRRQQHGA